VGGKETVVPDGRLPSVDRRTRGPSNARGRPLTTVFLMIYLSFGGVLGGFALLAPGYLRPGGWRIALLVIVILDLLTVVHLWFRGEMTLRAEKLWTYTATLTLVLAAMTPADLVGARLTTALFILSGLFGALCLGMVELLGLLFMVMVATTFVMWYCGDTGWLLVMHTMIVVVCTTGPAIMISLLRAHLAGALERSLHQASTDPLTGLANRRGMREKAPAVLNQARRTGDVVGLLLVDIDHFKQVNDTYGHQVGDEVLRDVAAAIRSCVRGDDVVVRMGGEEIAVLTSLARSGLVALGERIREAVVRDCAVTVSVGVAWSTPDGSDPDSVLKALTEAADEQLYAAKDGGRNQVRSPALSG
jgi:diguanylate cyclase (GGDEF)-like protein